VIKSDPRGKRKGRDCSYTSPCWLAVQNVPQIFQNLPDRWIWSKDWKKKKRVIWSALYLPIF